MRAFSFKLTVFIVLVAAVTAVSSVHIGAPASRADSGAMTFWEAAGRGLVTATVVNETYDRDGHTVTSPVGIRVNNAANVPVEVTEPAVLMSPHPLASPRPNPTQTQQDGVLAVQTIPAGGSFLYSYGEEVLQGFLPKPSWWCSEEFQFTQADTRYRIGGETLPFAARPILANAHYDGPDSNTQSDFWAYLHANATVVVGKEPLWTQIDGKAGARIQVTIDATNIALYTFDDAITADVNVTHGVLEDDVPAGWSVEEGSYSVAPDGIVAHPDGSHTLRWFVDLPAALASGSDDPRYPSVYDPAIRPDTLVSPALGAGRVELSRARSDMDANGVPDATSAAPLVDVVAVRVPVPDAGGPHTGHEGDTSLLHATPPRAPAGDSPSFPWDLTGPW